MTAHATGAPAFDRARLADIAKGSPVAAAEFRRTTELDTASLLKAAGASEPAQVIRSAHRIEGACMMIGAAALADACSGVAAAASPGNAVALRAALDVFIETRQRLHAFMDARDVVGLPGSPSPAGGRDGDQLCSGLVFLVVEDHEFQRGMIIRALRRLGAAEVHGFAEGADALDAARSLPKPGAILMLDLGMPTLDGIDIAHIAGAERLAVSVILHSAQSEDILLSQVENARAGGVEVLGAIGKPLTTVKLAPLIASHRRLIAGTAAGPPVST